MTSKRRIHSKKKAGKDLRPQKLKSIVRKELEKNDLAHRWDHAETVAKLCELIATDEKVDLNLLKAAAYLHDIEVPKEIEYGKHVEKGIRKAQRILKQAGYSDDEAQKVLQIIRRSEHFLDNALTPEEKVFADADRLDSIGARGVVRCLLFSGMRNKEFGNMQFDPQNPPQPQHPVKPESDTVLDHFIEKLLRVKDLMYTNVGKELAKEKHEFMISFLKQYFRETNLQKILQSE